MKLGALPLTLRQLQYVVAVAHARSFRGAAADCLVSQPSLSSQIAEVETALAVRIFERGRGGVLITTAGAEVVTRAEQILVAVDDLLDAAQQHIDPLVGRMRIGVIPTIAPYLLPTLDPALRGDFPQLELFWTEEKTSALVGLVERGELDAAVVALESDLHDLEHEEVGRDRFVLATARDHDLTRLRRRARMTDLENTDVLLLADGHCLRDQALDLCSKVAARELGFRATSLATLSQMVAGGRGATLLPGLAVELESQRVGLAIREFARPEPFRTIVLAWRKRSAISSSLRAVAAAMSSAFAISTDTRRAARGRKTRPR